MNTTANTEKNIYSIYHENGSSSNKLRINCLTQFDHQNIVLFNHMESHAYAKNDIEPEDKEEILSLRRDHFTAGICTFHFKEYIEQIFVYVMDHLSCFDDYYLLDFDDSQDTEFFYWDISNDTVIPYIVGLTPDRFKKFFQTIYGDYKIFVHIYGIYILQCSALFFL